MKNNDLLPDISKIKKIVQNIILNECKKYQINTKNLGIFPITRVEYYKECFKSKNFKLYNISVPLMCNGFFAGDYKSKEIVVFIKQRMAKNFVQVLSTTYHELRHLYQDTKVNAWSYEGLIFSMEQLLKSQNYKEYLYNHDKYFFEIDANLYGTKMTIEYLEINDINNNSKELEHLKMYERIYTYDYFNFNFSSLFEKFIKFYRKKGCSDLFFNFTIGVFLNKDGTFKSMNDIMINPNFSSLDKRSVYSIISSKIFLRELDFSTLNRDGQELIDEALKYQQILSSKRKLVNKRFFSEVILYQSISTQLSYLEIQMYKLNDFLKGSLKEKIEDNIINRKK